MLETPQKPPQQSSSGSRLAPRQLLSTRRGMLVVAFATAFVGAAILMVFLNQYRDSVGDSSKPVSVLVAKSFVEKGTSGDVIARTELSRREDIPKGSVKDGAVTDAAALRGKVASKSIYPGQQLTVSGFEASGGAVREKLTGNERAMSVALDSAHGLIGNIEAGDRVDLLAGFNVTQQGGGLSRPVLRTLVQDVLVLDAPKEKPSGSAARASDEEITVRVTDEQASAIAFSSDNGKVWVTLRPPAGARQSKARLVSLDALLVGLRPIRLETKGPQR